MRILLRQSIRRPRRSFSQNDSSQPTSLTEHWYSREYLAHIFARRPAQLLALGAFVVVAGVLVLVFASGSEVTSLSLSSGVMNGTSIGTDGAIRLSTLSTPVNTAPPTLSGSPSVGKTVSTSTGNWTDATSFSYQWELCDQQQQACGPITGATTASYQPGDADLGGTLRALVIASNGQGSSQTLSAASTIVNVRPLASTCSGTSITTSQEPETVIAAAASGTTFCFSTGRFSITQTLNPKTGDRLIGQPGSVLDAATVIGGWHLSGTRWSAATSRTTPTLDPGGGYNGSYKYAQAIYADDVFLDDAPLVKAGVLTGGRVIGSPLSSLAAGQYFFDYDHGQIYLGSDPTGHRVELASLPGGVIHSTNSSVTVKGLTTQGSIYDGIATGSGSGWQVLNNEARLNHSEGVRVSDAALVDDNYIHDNGTYGLASTGNNFTVKANEVAGNNTSRYYFADGGCSDAGGSKFTNSSSVTLTQNWFHDNLCIGIWFDIDNNNVTISNNHSDRNYENGIDYEISYHAQITGNEVSGNSHWCILDSASPSVTIQNNIISGCTDGGVILNQGPRTDHPSSLGPHYAQNVDVSNNSITMHAGLTGAQQFSVSGTSFNNVVFSSSNTFHGNRYFLANLTGRWFEWQPGQLTISAWQAAGQDVDSSFVQE